MITSPSFWSGRRVLVTGHTGFKGAWLCAVLADQGADVTGYALAEDPPGGAFERLAPHDRLRSIIGDIRDPASLHAAFAESQPEVVFHLAAQALVRASIADPVGTYDINVTGTAAVLREVSGSSSARVAVIVTSDKVYANDGAGRAFVEGDRLGGGDPYSASKAAAELVVASWRHSFAPAGEPVLLTARAGNVIGGGDLASDRLLPDLFRAVAAGQPLVVRHPDSVRPWQFVLEPAFGYLALAEAGWTRPEVPPSLNFGPDTSACWTVRALVERALELYGEGSWEPAPRSDDPEAAVLRLDASLAERALGWRPRLELDEALSWTVDWYRAARAGEDLGALGRDQIARYRALVSV